MSFAECYPLVGSKWALLWSPEDRLGSRCAAAQRTTTCDHAAARARTSASRMDLELAEMDAPSTPSMPPPLKDADDFMRGALGASAWWRKDSQTVQVIVRLPEDASFKRDVSVDLSRRRIDLAVLGDSRGERSCAQLLLSLQVRRYWNRTFSILTLTFRF